LKIQIDDAVDIICPDCERVVGIRNDQKIMFKNVSWVVTEVDGDSHLIKCRKCKYVSKVMVKIKK